MERCGILVKTIKIAFLCQWNTLKAKMGGADIHIQNILNLLSKIDNLEIHVITLSKSISKSSTDIQDGIKYHIIKSPNIPRTITGITIDHNALIKKTRKINPDIVHAQVLGAPYGLAAMKLCKEYPTLLTAHTIVDLDSRNRTRTIRGEIHDSIWKILEKKEIKRIPHFIAVSKNIEEELKKRGARNVNVIPNGISDKWFNIPNKGIEGRILFVGRVIPIKAIEVLINAMKTMKEQLPIVHLHIVGPVSDKDYKRKLDDLIVKMALQNEVTFTGPKSGSELENEYSECSVFVLPSKSESNPIVLLEAMATGKPIIATNVGGIPEMLDDGKEGFLIEFGNIEKMAEKIKILVENKELRAEMGKSGKNRARNNTWNNIAERTMKFYKKILKGEK